MTLAICIPSRGRPGRIEAVVKNIRETTEDFNLYYVIEDSASAKILNGLDVQYWELPGSTYVEKINFCAKATSEDYFVCGTDGMIFSPEWWVRPLYAVSVVHGAARIGGGGNAILIDRGYIESGCCVDAPGFVYNPEYIHWYCDWEVMDTARARGRLVRCGRQPIGDLPYPGDETQRMMMAAWSHDEKLYKERQPLVAAIKPEISMVVNHATDEIQVFPL